ncbi:MAG: hypothetical protein Q9173_005274 [Seirophora scorigena]
MTTAAEYLERKSNSARRPGLSHLQADPSSPHTPLRTFSSTFSSPSISYRAEEEVLVFELGARHLSAGISGESNPRCRLSFSPDHGRRVGDYRCCLPEYYERTRKRKRKYSWGEDHELWRMDLRGVDLGLVEDKIERAVRKAFAEYLLLDSKNKRLVLVLPSLMPHRLLSSILSSIFSNFQTPSITLFPSPVLVAVAAGCRAGLVVDIGWAETTMTAVYELREVFCARTTLATRLVTLRMADLLKEYAESGTADTRKQASALNDEELGSGQFSPDSRYFDFAEEVSSRIAWCPIEPRPAITSSEDTVAAQTPEQGERVSGTPAEDPQQPHEHTKISIPSPLPPRKTLQIPFDKLSEPVEDGLFATGKDLHDLDDHEQPLQQLLYKTLLSLPPDVRSQCMARITITGGGSNIPGLKTRLLNALKAIVQARGWDPVSGKVATETRKHLETVRSNQLNKAPTGVKQTTATHHLQPQVKDSTDEKIKAGKMKTSTVTAAGEIRGVETLGAWAGGSLVAGLKVKGVVEVERDSFLANGFAGAKKESEITQATQRMSLLGPRSGVGEKTGWTLGAWA